MRYAEIDSGRVRYVLPANLAGDYEVKPPNAVEIALNADVLEGDVYENGVFRRAAEAELIAEARNVFTVDRDRLFSSSAWVRQRHEDRVELGIDDGVNWTAWLNYWQALRDMPEQAGFDPRNPVWPEKPE